MINQDRPKKKETQPAGNSSFASSSLPFKKESTRNEALQRVASARHYIDNNLNTKLDLKSLSRVACISRFHLLRIFTQVFGISPHHYQLVRKLERARYLINSTNESLTDIAAAVAFHNYSYFSTKFKQTYGHSPDVERKRNKRLPKSQAGERKLPHDMSNLRI